MAESLPPLDGTVRQTVFGVLREAFQIPAEEPVVPWLRTRLSPIGGHHDMSETAVDPRVLATWSAAVEDGRLALREACENGFKLRASIPARPEHDHDLRIGTALKAAEAMLAALAAPPRGGSE